MTGGPHPVAHRWRNHISPWMTESEIKRSVAQAERLYWRLPETERAAFSREHEPDRDWPKGGEER